MARNSLAPGYVVIHYTVAGLEHTQTLPVFPVMPAGTGTLLFSKGGSSIAWVTAITAYLNASKGLFSSADATLDFADLFTQADEFSAPVFQDTHSFAIAGTNATATTESGQAVFGWRTQNGGRGKSQWMETAFPDDFIQVPASYGTDAATFATYVLGATSIVYARDGSFMSSGIRLITKENDKLRKIRLNL